MRSCPERAYILAFFALPPPLSDENPLLRIRVNYFRPYLSIPRVCSIPMKILLPFSSLRLLPLLASIVAFFLSLVVRPALPTVLLFEADILLAYCLSSSFEILLLS